ncbi:MAG TPA: OmpH family outer membrane protein [Bryobacteraceae bacterium]|nr:OmpH family outer membrane protein [Bryobacteraceae bacterium]
MKHFFAVSLALSAAAIAAAQAPPPAAAPTKVAVINIQAAIATTKDGQGAAADLDKRFSPKKDELAKRQQEIKDLQDKLQRNGNTLSQTAKDDMQRQIDQKTRGFNYDMQDAQSEYETEQRKLVDDIGGKLLQVIDKYAQTNGYAVVLDVSNQNSGVLYASNGIDITKEIIDLYDKTAASLPALPRAPATAAPKQVAPPKPAAPKPAAPAKP